MEKVSFSTTILKYAYHATESEAAANPAAAATLQGSHKSSSHQFPQHSPLLIPIRIMFHIRKRSWNSLTLPSCVALRTCRSCSSENTLPFTSPKLSLLGNPLELLLTVHSWLSHPAQISIVALKNLPPVLLWCGCLSPCELLMIIMILMIVIMTDTYIVPFIQRIPKCFANWFANNCTPILNTPSLC